MADSGTTNINSLPTGNSKNNIVLETKELSSKEQQQPQPNSQMSREQIAEIVREIQSASSKGMTNLPSRDIPQNTNHLTQDEQMRPNYVPQTNKTDYIDDLNTEEYLLQQNNSKKNEDHMEAIYNELQAPIFVMILFFLFQMPFINKNFRKFFPSLFKPDLSPNIWGYLFQTITFGILFYSIQRTIKYLS